ncbi:hypothetical protein [Paenibacillus naphthalenovorans]|uniref:Uncharacterized protein n=1 Tax=Paenibacillus naphthalenovorans TaxID=162209 RepID=A0A0U2KZ50_9BACL|nr:hypothetical protein [Paenibacillus naphthalenovorans]ALS22290.1 hypothetical protein IJ22_19160 [Paenibacillus naphthalenovorans]
MNLILNEKEAAYKALNEGYIDKKPTNTIKILIKYYYNMGMNKEQVRNSIEEFMKNNYKRFNSVKWNDLLDKLVKKEEKLEHKLLEIDYVNITINELKTIQNINNLNLEKLAFVLLVYSKIYNQMNGNNSNWVNASRKDIFDDSKINTSTHQQRLMINDLINLGLIEKSKRKNSTNRKVCFADENSEVEIKLDDFRDFVYQYLKWKGEKIGNCEKCNRPIKPSGKNHKMCRECWKDRREQQNREKALRYYHKNKNK